MGQILGMIRVKHSSAAIKETFGKPDGVLQSGCHCVPWCCGSSVAGQVCLKLQTVRIHCKTKTKDDVFFSVIASIEYQITPEKASIAFYKLNSIRELIEGLVTEAVRASVANLSMDEAYEKQRDIAAAVEEGIKQVTLDYGIEIVRILMVDAEPAEPTMRAMSQTNAAAHMRFAKNEMSEAKKKIKMKKAREELDWEYMDELQQAREKDFRDGLRMKGYVDTTNEMEASSSVSVRGSCSVSEITPVKD